MLEKELVPAGLGHHSGNAREEYLKQSKTDQLRQDTDIYMGRTGNDLCPVSSTA